VIHSAGLLALVKIRRTRQDPSPRGDTDSKQKEERTPKKEKQKGANLPDVFRARFHCWTYEPIGIEGRSGERYDLPDRLLASRAIFVSPGQ